MSREAAAKKKRSSGGEFQQDLLCDLPPGVTLFRGMVTRSEQEQLLGEVRRIVRLAPLLQPTMADGTPMHFQLTNCGQCGWITGAEGTRYVETHPQTGKPWPPIPKAISEVAERAARQTGTEHFEPHVCQINYYRAPEGCCGLHQDKAERDLVAPVITISMGETAVFGIGGVYVTSKVEEVSLDSGDVLVMSGPARMYYHAVKRLLPGTSKLLRDGGRISLTLRRMH